MSGSSGRPSQIHRAGTGGHEPIDARSFRSVVVFVALGATLSIIAVITTLRFLYADSSHFLLSMWESGSFAIQNRSRWVGFAASQWLPASAMQLGWSDLRGIALLYGVNLWLNPVLAVAAAWWASERSREATLAVLLSVLFLFQTTYVVIDNEASVFFWLAQVLLILTVRPDFRYRALVLFAPIIFTHEALVLAFGPILVILLVGRRRYEAYYGAKRFWSLVSGFALAVALVTVRVVRPADEIIAQNRTYFIEGALSLPGSPSLVLTSIAFGALALHAVRPALRWPTPVFWSSAALLLILPFAAPELLWPFYHYRARILNAALALLLFLYLHGRTVWQVVPPARLPVRRVLAVAAVVFLFQGKLTWEWSRHVALFRDELATEQGIVDFPTEGPFAEPRSRQFSWSWTSPVRSIVFQAMDDGEVRSIMLNADTTIRQPFRPRIAGELPDLSAFGVRYAPEITAPAGGA